MKPLVAPEYAIIVTYMASNLVFDTPQDAEQEAKDCKGGLIVEL